LVKEKLWLNGKCIDQEQGLINIATASLHYGTSIFEGILCLKVKSPERRVIFRIDPHLERMFASAQVLNYKIPFTFGALRLAMIELIKVNHYDSAYIRPIIFEDNAYLSLGASSNKLNVAILAKKFNSTLYRWNMRRPAKVCIAGSVINTWSDELGRAKISGKYLNSVIAKKEAYRQGADDAIILDRQGYVSEATSANVFMVRANVVKTPPRKNTVNGITQDSVLRILKDLGYTAKEESILPEELLAADEVFLTNTAAGIVPVSQIGSRPICNQSKTSLIKRLRNKYINALTAQDPHYQEWLDFIKD